MIKLNSRDWSVLRAPSTRDLGRRSAAALAGFPAQFLTDQSEVVEEFVAQPHAGRRGAEPPGPLDFSCDVAEGEAAVLAIRHPSGALTFHVPVESARRTGTRGQEVVRFRISVRSTDPETGRRGVISQAVKAILIKVNRVVGDKAASFVISRLAAAVERRAWSSRGLKEGWLRVSRDTLSRGSLEPGQPHGSERSLLFLHGTFSNAASAFGPLAESDFFDRVAARYGDRIFAFDHFTLSRTPEENARMLLEALPDEALTFDVVTHSRGGLVLRNLVERAPVFGALARRFRLGHAVLVASPNGGTPLATPSRWQDTVGWIANLLELLPENPFTTGAEFVANGLVWLARHATGDIPGLHSMDSAGEPIGELQSPPGPPPDGYSALVSNYHPTGDVLRRMIDVGVDQFFGMPNDLVVPTEGGWRVDDGGVTHIPATRIGCFGPGGNLPLDAVTHVNFFSQRETVEFLVPSLAGQATSLVPVDPGKALPDRRVVRSSESGGARDAAGLGRVSPVTPAAALGGPMQVTVDGAAFVASDTFHLVVLPCEETDSHRSTILAHYGSARVLEDFRLGGGKAGRRWEAIIDRQRAIKNYIDRNQGAMPTGAELRDFGIVLFETLFPGAVRRLFDTARSLQRSDRLNVILTSTIPWVGDIPWEFAHDPVRRTSLATEDIHFIRNVMTAVPAEVIDDRNRLRILVASSQPVGLGRLSVEEESALIRRGFEPLREAGLADVEVLARATPASLHGYVSTGRYSIVHFIGHGEFDHAEQRGYLIFQDELGNPYRVGDRSVREILCGRAIRLVFLNACETGQGGSADFNSGIAPALVAGGVPIVVANQYKVLDASATYFAQHFYWALAQGMRVGEAAREARIAVNYSLAGESIDWAVPVLYARDPNSRLSPERAREAKVAPSPAVRPSGRRTTAQHKIRVAVWDTNAQFPQLRSTLERMSAVQSFYGFEIVDLSMPIDGWHMSDGERFLDADRFAERLGPQIPQLGVHYVSAIIDEWMVEDVTSEPNYYIYGWWPLADKPPVLIFSTKGLGLEPSGVTTDRAIANVAVSGIAGYLLAEGSHSNGAHDCPNYYNPDRKLSILTGRQKFCQKCVSRLRLKHRDELKALNAILGAFD